MKIPFKLTTCMPLEERRQHVMSAVARGLPRLQDTAIDDTKTMHVACYGPSLADTWQDLRHPIISMSGATRFLAERGVVSDFHIEMDPRPHKAALITPPVPGVTYLVASCCHPNYFDALAGEKVLIWHNVNGSEPDDLVWLSQVDPFQLLVQSGSNIGLGAIQIGGLLGYRHFEIHGMDGSFADGKRHAAEHSGKPQAEDQIWRAGGHPYRTSRIMSNGVAEAINNMKSFPIFCVFHGAGLVQALIREAGLPNACCADETEKAERVRAMKAHFVAAPAVATADMKCWSPWDVLGCARMDPKWLEELQASFAEAETRRQKADFNTGSISIEAALQLRAVCEWKKPTVAVEIGTFIGNSTAALRAQKIFTCDERNDCLPASETVVTHPKQTSAEMLAKLRDQQVKADLFFVDGRLSDNDVPLVLETSAPGAVYIFDDYFPRGKGETNVKKLKAALPSYGFVAPYQAFKGRSNLAMLVPTA